MKKLLINKKVVILLFLLMLFVRIVKIEADAPISLNKYPDVFTDEGYKTYLARNMALFKTSVLEGDEYGGILKNSHPVNNYLYYIFFLIFGVGYVQARITAIVFSFLILIFYYGLIKRSFDKRVALLSTFFMGFSYIFIMYNRLALMESIMIFFLIVSLYFWKIGIDNKKPFYYLFSFVSFILAYFIKESALFFIPVLMVMGYFSFIKGITIKKLKKNKFIIAFTILIFLGIILLLIPKFLSNIIHILRWRGDSIFMAPAYLIDLVINPFFKKTIVMSALLLIYPIFLLLKLSRHEKINPLETIFLIWFVSLFYSFSLTFYQAPRYLILFIPAMSLIGSLVLINISNVRLIKIRKQSFLFNVLLIILLCMITMAALINIYPLFDTYMHKIYYALFSIVVSLIMGSFIFITFRKISIKLRKGITSKLVAFIIILFVLVNMGQYLNWFLHPNYTLIDSSREMNELLPQDAVLLGGWAPALCLETRFRCYNVGGEANIDRYVFKRLNVSHIIMSDYAWVEEEFKKNPNYNKSITLIKTFVIAKEKVHLYKIDKEVYYSTDFDAGKDDTVLEKYQKGRGSLKNGIGMVYYWG